MQGVQLGLDLEVRLHFKKRPLLQQSQEPFENFKISKLHLDFIATLQVSVNHQKCAIWLKHG